MKTEQKLIALIVALTFLQFNPTNTMNKTKEKIKIKTEKFTYEPLDKEVYKEKAIKLLDILKIKTLDKQKEIEEYLNKRIKNSTQITSGNCTEKEENSEFKVLDAQWTLFFVLNQIDTDPGARAIYHFPKMVAENMAFVLRKNLKCRTSEGMEDFEKKYEFDLEKVTAESLRKKMKEQNWIQENLDKVRLKESKRFAKYILKRMWRKKTKQECGEKKLKTYLIN